MTQEDYATLMAVLNENLAEGTPPPAAPVTAVKAVEPKKKITDENAEVTANAPVTEGMNAVKFWLVLTGDMAVVTLNLDLGQPVHLYLLSSNVYNFTFLSLIEA